MFGVAVKCKWEDTTTDDENVTVATLGAGISEIQVKTDERLADPV